jgi:hypothetical protein
MQEGPREYRGVVIWPKNVYGMYSARVDVPDGGQSVAADTLAGIKSLIREAVGR